MFGLGFAEALAYSLRRKKCKYAITITTLNLILTRAHSALSFLQCFLKLKKGKDVWFCVWRLYGRFLTAISIRAPTMAIAMIIAITPAAMYVIRSVVFARFD